ncbi:MAG: hypothetical protein QOI98_1605 [Solirubrobacteraceae bacterium]|nr:hypothetical protein [Solirubrobacteraceae bacterium]
MSDDAAGVGGPLDGVEEVDGLPVLADPRVIEAPPLAPLMTPHAAAVAAPGFVAGIATVAVVRRRRARKQNGRRLLRRAGRGDSLNVVGTRSFLVDLHLLGGRD